MYRQYEIHDPKSSILLNHQILLPVVHHSTLEGYIGQLVAALEDGEVGGVEIGGLDEDGAAVGEDGGDAAWEGEGGYLGELGEDELYLG